MPAALARHYIVTSVLNNGKDVIANAPGDDRQAEVTLVYREKQWNIVCGNGKNAYIPVIIAWK